VYCARCVTSCWFPQPLCCAASRAASNDSHACTQLNIGTNSTDAFPTAANAAFNMTLNPPFSPYANNLFFIHGAFIFEDVGVTAYQVHHRRHAAVFIPGLLSVQQQGHVVCERRSLQMSCLLGTPHTS